MAVTTPYNAPETAEVLAIGRSVHFSDPPTDRLKQGD